MTKSKLRKLFVKKFIDQAINIIKTRTYGGSAIVAGVGLEYYLNKSNIPEDYVHLFTDHRFSTPNHWCCRKNYLESAFQNALK